MPAAIQKLPFSWLRWRELTRFPVDWVTGDPRIGAWAAKAIWLLIPLQYYTLIQFPGGFLPDDFEAVCVILLLYILAIFFVSSALGVLGLFRGLRFHREPGLYNATVRMWSIALFATWGTSLGLLGISYLLGTSSTEFRNKDVVGFLICHWRGHRCPGGYPLLNLQTLFAYLVYSFCAALLVSAIPHALQGLSRVHRRLYGLAPAAKGPDEGLSAVESPNVLIVAILNAAVMTLLFGWTTWFKSGA